MKEKLTRKEKNWILYDVANSAFIMLIATIIPIYFDYLLSIDGKGNAMVYMGYTTSAVTLILAILGPILGTISDNSKIKLPIFLTLVLFGVTSCVLLSIPMHWLAFLIIFSMAKLGCNSSIIFYDSMLGDITEEKKLDKVSSLGYAFGYIGSCIPFVICIVLVLLSQAQNPILPFQTAITVSFLLTAAWWLILSLPLIKSYKQNKADQREKVSIKNTFKGLWNTLKDIAKTKYILIFLIAFFFYIDAVYTIIDLATSYGADLGFDKTGLLIALLVTQVVAFPSTLVFGKLSSKISVNKLLIVCISAYIVIGVVAVLMYEAWVFWLLAVLVGLFQGAIQALSRSYFTKIVPEDKRASYFSVLDICGKSSSALGAFLVSTITLATNNSHIGVAILPVMLVVGLILFIIADRKYNKSKKNENEAAND